MLGTNYQELEEKLDTLGYTESNKANKKVRKAIIELFHTLDAQSPDDYEQRRMIIELFNSIGRAKLTPQGTSSRWGDFRLGETRPGETVRVRRDAYQGAGERHNGLTGTISAIRGGRVLVQYTGRNDGIGHSHHPDFIEVLVKE